MPSALGGAFGGLRFIVVHVGERDKVLAAHHRERAASHDALRPEEPVVGPMPLLLRDVLHQHTQRLREVVVPLERLFLLIPRLRDHRGNL